MGVPVHDDRRLFEMLCLEGAQAGLSWLTILRKRDAYRRAFDGFDPESMARYGAAKRKRLMSDSQDRAQPAQDRGVHQQRARLPRHLRPAGRVRCLHLAIHRRQDLKATPGAAHRPRHHHAL